MRTLGLAVVLSLTGVSDFYAAQANTQEKVVVVPKGDEVLLNDVSAFFARTPKFRDRGELSLFLHEAFPVGTPESVVREKLALWLRQVQGEPNVTHSVWIRRSKVGISIHRVFDRAPEYGGPEYWTLEVGVFFDRDHRVEDTVHSIASGNWEGPVDLIEKKEPNQSSEPTAMSVTPPAAQEPRQP